CRTATLDGRALAEVPEVREHMVDLFVDAEINRLFGLRNYWLAHTNQPRSYEGSQSSYYRKISGLRMFEAMQQALGYSALTSDDRWGAMRGFAESYPPSSIIALHPGATADVQKMIMARRIGIGRGTREEAGRLE